MWLCFKPFLLNRFLGFDIEVPKERAKFVTKNEKRNRAKDKER